MRAVLVTEPTDFECLAVAEVPDPQPGPGEVVVDVAAAEANFPDRSYCEVC